MVDSIPGSCGRPPWFPRILEKDPDHPTDGKLPEASVSSADELQPS